MGPWLSCESLGWLHSISEIGFFNAFVEGKFILQTSLEKAFREKQGRVS